MGSKIAYSRKTLALLSVVLALGLSAQAQTLQEETEAARTLFQKNKDCVITLLVVQKRKFNFGPHSQESESRQEVTGTIISPDGLTVMSLATVDPSTVMRGMMSTDSSLDGGPSMSVDSEISDLKMLLDGDREIPAEIVLRDADLDLAFARPLTPVNEPLPYLDLTQSGEPSLLDRVVSISRLGKVANRVHGLSFEFIEAIVEKPRRFYIPGNSPTLTSQGCPAFLLDGRVAGIFVMRIAKDRGTQSGSMFSGLSNNIIGIMLPPDQILEVAKQVPERNTNAGNTPPSTPNADGQNSAGPSSQETSPTPDAGAP